ncbi:IS3 family transposase [Schaalia sp. ZJ405]|nr:IS3 family transposase [Schaalia sp. ZJ405]
MRDRDLVAKVGQIHAANYGVYGVRKMWHALSRCGLQVGHKQTARLMPLAGVSGKAKGGAPSPHAKLGGKIPGQIWSTASFVQRVRTGCGSPISRMYEPSKGSCMRRS